METSVDNVEVISGKDDNITIKKGESYITLCKKEIINLVNSLLLKISKETYTGMIMRKKIISDRIKVMVDIVCEAIGEKDFLNLADLMKYGKFYGSKPEKQLDAIYKGKKFTQGEKAAALISVILGM